jgi:hypothetical protein
MRDTRVTRIRKRKRQESKHDPPSSEREADDCAQREHRIGAVELETLLGFRQRGDDGHEEPCDNQNAKRYREFQQYFAECQLMLPE